MKKTFLILFLSIATFNLFAQGINFFGGTLMELKTKALQENKIIFVDAYTTWCGPCKWMSANTFPDKEVGNQFNTNFISYKFDMEKGEGLQFAKDYNVRAYPSLVFIDGKGNLVHKAIGALDATELIQLGKDAMNPEVRLSSLTEQYEEGRRDNAFIQKYLNTASNAMIDVKEAADWYFHTQSKEALLSAENYDLITSFVRNPNHPTFKFLVNNKDTYQEIMGKDISVDRTIRGLYQQHLKAASKKGEEAYRVAVQEMKESGYKDSDRILAGIKLAALINGKTQDWAQIADAITTYFDQHAPEDWQGRNRYAWMYYEHQDITDTKILASALAWAKKSVELKPLYMNTDTYAALLYKMNRKKEGIAIANQAIKLAKESGADPSETEELLEKIKALK